MRLLFVLAVLAFTVAFSSSANAGECWVKYELDEAGTIHSEWQNLGNVSWPNRLNKCRALAQSAANGYVLPLLPTYAPVESDNLRIICNRGYANIRLIIELRNPYSRRAIDHLRVPVTCEQSCDCPSDRWFFRNPQGAWCDKVMCENFNGVVPANDTSFMQNQGFFFWDGQLRHRTAARCQWAGIVGAPYGDNASWTGWLNRDRPGGTGDWETVADFVAAGQGCANPIDIQCRRVSDQLDWSQTGDNYSCSLPQGGVCINAQNPGGDCHDYEIRLLCPR